MKLKELRVSKGLTRYRLSKDAKLDWGQLVEVEEGRSGMRIDNAIRVADVLGCSLDELVMGPAAASGPREAVRETPELYVGNVDEKTLLVRYRALPPKQRQAVLELLKPAK